MALASQAATIPRDTAPQSPGGGSFLPWVPEKPLSPGRCHLRLPPPPPSPQFATAPESRLPASICGAVRYFACPEGVCGSLGRFLLNKNQLYFLLYWFAASLLIFPLFSLWICFFPRKMWSILSRSCGDPNTALILSVSTPGLCQHFLPALCSLVHNLRQDSGFVCPYPTYINFSSCEMPLPVIHRG